MNKELKEYAVIYNKETGEYTSLLETIAITTNLFDNINEKYDKSAICRIEDDKQIFWFLELPTKYDKVNKTVYYNKHEILLEDSDIPIFEEALKVYSGKVVKYYNYSK